MTTVLMLNGALSESGNAAVIAADFGGPQALLTQLGDTSTAIVAPVAYNDWDLVNGYIDGANKLNTAINAVPHGNIVVLGHSYGSVAICEWFRMYGATSEVDPARITFVLAANSIRPNNGLCTMLGLYGGAGPVTDKFTTYDAARQFDKWADYPNVHTSPEYSAAVKNCSHGDMLKAGIHLHYENVSLTDPNAARITIGTVTFLLLETDPLPSPSGVTRAQIETAYNRIVPAPNW